MDKILLWHIMGRKVEVRTFGDTPEEVTDRNRSRGSFNVMRHS